MNYAAALHMLRTPSMLLLYASLTFLLTIALTLYPTGRFGHHTPDDEKLIWCNILPMDNQNSILCWFKVP